MQLHEERRAGQSEKNYYDKHLQAFYVMRDSLAPFQKMDWDVWHDWYNFQLRNDPPALAAVLRAYAKSLM